ncbi:MAG: DUF488 domain-containing protein [Thermoplasmata archaeon]|nr:MAG: DUF488 domain-containing protein [Thermoplasmata archaeon]
MKVYTIGHSNRSMEDFLKLLKKYNIECIIDVRRFPTSKFEDYKKERLEKTLYEHGIKYFHFAALGGFRGGYEKWMLSNEWKDAYEKLKKIAMKCKLAILCTEKLPFRCHRRYIAKALAKDGWDVVHIINGIWKEKS